MKFEELKKLVEQGPNVVVLSSTHCGPCRAMAPVLDDIDQCPVHKLDVYDDLDLAAKLNVDSVPTMLFFKDGLELGRLVGIQTKAEIQEQVEKISGLGGPQKELSE